MGRIGLWIPGALALALASAPVSPAQAASHAHDQPPPAASAGDVSTTETLGSSGGWSAYASHDKTGRVCYLAGHPQKSEAAGVARRRPMAMVTHRPTENIANVVSFIEGYTLKPGSEVTLDVGGKKFDLFTRDDSAWARTSDLDRTIVTALDHAGYAVVKGEPEKGLPTTDVYSLAGFSRALALIDKACGVSRAGVAAAPSATTASHPHQRRPAHKIAHKPRPQHG